MDVDEFYDDPERADSNEVTFGSTWRAQGVGPWKLVWLEATGELVAFNEQVDQQWPTDPRERTVNNVGALIVGSYEAPWIADDEVVVIGVEADREQLEARLTGWEQHLDDDNGLGWVAVHFDPPESDEL